MKLEKDPPILELVERLGLVERGWVVEDHWDADLCAIGIAKHGSSGSLVYVSTWKKPPGRYYFECDLYPPGDEGDFETVAKGDEVSFDELVRAMEAHLG